MHIKKLSNYLFKRHHNPLFLIGIVILITTIVLFIPLYVYYNNTKQDKSRINKSSAAMSGRVWYIAKQGSAYTADFYADSGTTNNVVIQQAINGMAAGDTLKFYPGKYYIDYPITATGINIEGPQITPSNIPGYNTFGVFDDPNAATLIIKNNLTDTTNWKWGTTMLKIINGSVKNMVFDGNVNNNTGGYFRMGDLYLNLLEVHGSTAENNRFQNGFCDGIRHGSNNTIRGNFFTLVHHDNVAGLYPNLGGSSNNLIENNTIRRPYTTNDKVNNIGWWYNAGFRMYSGKSNIYRNNYIDCFGSNEQCGTLGFEIHGVRNIDSSNNIIENNTIKDVNESAIWFMEAGYRPKSSQATLRGQIVRNNLIVNASKGVTFSSDSDYNSTTKTWTILPGNWNEVTIENNTFVNVGLTGIYALGAIYEMTTYNGIGNQQATSALSGNIYVKNNIFYNTKAGIGSQSGGLPSWFKSSYNLFYNTPTTHGTGVTIGTGNIFNQNPLFVSSTDFHLQPGSPAIGAGENGVNMGADVDNPGTVSPTPSSSTPTPVNPTITSTPTPTQAPTPTPTTPLGLTNLITNPGLEGGTSSWIFYTNGYGSFAATTPSYSGTKAAKISINTQGSNTQLFQIGIPLEPNSKYRLSFSAYSSTGHDVTVNLQKHTSPYTNYGLAYTPNLTSSWQTFSTEFTSSGFQNNIRDGRLMFWLTPHAASGDIYYIDDIRLEKVTNITPSTTIPPSTPTPSPVTPGLTTILLNSDFESGAASWLFYTNGLGSFTAGTPAYSGTKAGKISLNTISSNMQLYQTNVALEPNTRYRLMFSAYSSTGHDMNVKLFKHFSPYTSYGLNYIPNLTTSWQTFTTEFTTSGSAYRVTDGRFQLNFPGFASTGDIYYIDDIRLEKVTTE